MPKDKIIITTASQREIIDITNVIAERINKQAGELSWASLFLLHTTAGLTTAALSPTKDLDLLTAIEVGVPKGAERFHRLAHLPAYMAAAFLGPCLSVPLQNGKLQLGDLQRIILVELNGPRDRSIILEW